jgi:hypothetical protein
MNLIKTIWDTIQAAEVQAVGPELIAFNNAVMATPTLPTLVMQGQLLIAQAGAKQPQIAIALAADLATTINGEIEAQIAKATAAKSA